MTVNFVRQMRLIMEYGKRNKLSSYERMFYIALFYCANACAMATENQDWPEEYFPVSNSDINGWTGFDERAIRNLRNSLKNRGLIDFKKGDGKKRDPEYMFFYLQQTGYKIAPVKPQTAYKNAGDKVNGSRFAPDKTQTDCEFAPDSVGDSVGDSVPDSVGDRVVTDCKFAPDSGLSSYSDKNKKEKEKKNINQNVSGEEEHLISSDHILPGKEDAMRSDGDSINDALTRSVIAGFETRIKKNIDYDSLLISHPYDIRLIDNIVDLIVEQMVSRSEETVISAGRYPTEYVKRKFLKLDYSHIEYVLDCFRKNTTKVQNIKKYLLAALFNAPSTIEGYYDAEVRHDMPGLAGK